jgi:vancomycin resistance protein YoaR
MILACTPLILVIIIGVYIPVTYGQTATQEQKESYQELINYCFQHADRPNPIQDLIDKVFLSSSFKGETCISVKQTYNTIVNELAIQQAIQQEKLAKELAQKHAQKDERNAKYLECARNTTTTYEECNRIREGIIK